MPRRDDDDYSQEDFIRSMHLFASQPVITPHFAGAAHVIERRRGADIDAALSRTALSDDAGPLRQFIFFAFITMTRHDNIR